jgi:acid stress-induced BolA-like protein IbaG/YrbA
VTATEIQQAIAAGLTCDVLKVEGDDGQHFSALIVSAAFEGKSRVQRHQVVYATLGSRMGREIHALSMQTFTPAEFGKLDG